MPVSIIAASDFGDKGILQKLSEDLLHTELTNHAHN